jgi:phospholipid/cholesterol/gamma-HCH transport system substrate-binding protein
MDKQKFSNLKVGLTVFIGLVIFFIFIFLVGIEGQYFSENYHLKIFVENVEGLANGSMVTLGGLKVGTIDKMEFAKRNGKNGIDITLNILKKYKEQITRQSTASISTKGLLGDKFINISLGQPGDESLNNDDFITVQPTLSLDVLSEKIEPSIEDFSKLMLNLRMISDTIMNGNSSIGRLIKNPYAADDLERILKNLNSFTTAIVEEKGSLGKLTYDTRIYNELANLSANLSSFSDSLRYGSGSLAKLINDNTLYDNIHLISERLNNLLNQAEQDSSVVGGLFTNKQLYNDFNSIVKDLNFLISEIKTNPEKYLRISVF